MSRPPEEARERKIDDFVGEPTRDLSDWRWLWTEDRPFPIRSHRGPLGWLLVRFKRLLRPLVKVPANDLWERQRVFNLILLENLKFLHEVSAGSRKDIEHHADRLAILETLPREDLAVVLRHNDALFARVDQKLDRYRGEARRLWGHLGAALAELETAGPVPLVRARDEYAYLELEHFHRGTEEEIGDRLEPYLGYLEGRERVLDLGCGRGEALELLGERGVGARGVDGNEQMVALCLEKGLQVEQGDLFEYLAGVEPESLDGVVSFHVIEHLPPAELDRLTRLAWRALEPGGVLIFETPNPLSIVVAARNFWLDPTHRRPVHPESLKLLLEMAGFAEIERIDLRPFPDEDRLPEVDVAELSRELHPLADQINALRDQLDELLYGAQDYAMVGVKPVAAGPSQRAEGD